MLLPSYVSQIVFVQSPREANETGEYFVVAQAEKTLYGVRMIAGDYSACEFADEIVVLDDWKVVSNRQDDPRALAFAKQLQVYMVGDKRVTGRVNEHGRLIERVIEQRNQVVKVSLEQYRESCRRRTTSTIGIDIGKGGISVSGLEVGDISVDTGSYVGRLVHLRVDPTSFGEDGKYIIVGSTKDTLLGVRVFKDYVPSTVTPFRHGKYSVVEVIRDDNAVPSIVGKFEKALDDFTGQWDRDVRRGVIVNISLIWQAINLRKNYLIPTAGRQIASKLEQELRRSPGRERVR